MADELNPAIQMLMSFLSMFGGARPQQQPSWMSYGRFTPGAGSMQNLDSSGLLQLATLIPGLGEYAQNVLDFSKKNVYRAGGTYLHGVIQKLLQNLSSVNRRKTQSGFLLASDQSTLLLVLRIAKTLNIEELRKDNLYNKFEEVAAKTHLIARILQEFRKENKIDKDVSLTQEQKDKWIKYLLAHTDRINRLASSGKLVLQFRKLDSKQQVTAVKQAIAESNSNQLLNFGNTARWLFDKYGDRIGLVNANFLPVSAAAALLLYLGTRNLLLLKNPLARNSAMASFKAAAAKVLEANLKGLQGYRFGGASAALISTVARIMAQRGDLDFSKLNPNASKLLIDAYMATKGKALMEKAGQFAANTRDLKDIYGDNIEARILAITAVTGYDALNMSPLQVQAVANNITAMHRIDPTMTSQKMASIAANINTLDKTVKQSLGRRGPATSAQARSQMQFDAAARLTGGAPTGMDTLTYQQQVMSSVVGLLYSLGHLDMSLAYGKWKSLHPDGTPLLFMKEVRAKGGDYLAVAGVSSAALLSKYRNSLGAVQARQTGVLKPLLYELQAELTKHDAVLNAAYALDLNDTQTQNLNKIVDDVDTLKALRGGGKAQELAYNKIKLQYGEQVAKAAMAVALNDLAYASATSSEKAQHALIKRANLEKQKLAIRSTEEGKEAADKPSNIKSDILTALNGDTLAMMKQLGDKLVLIFKPLISAIETALNKSNDKDAAQDSGKPVKQDKIPGIHTKG